MTEFDLEITSQSEIRKIPGLTYIPNYIHPDEQKQLLDLIDQQVWLPEIERRIQQYGYRFNHNKGTLVSSSYLGNLPDWVGRLTSRLYEDRLTEKILPQIIANEYQAGQGLGNHIDNVVCFGNTIVSLSLGSCCVMEFTHAQTQEKIPILLLPGSLLVMQGIARYGWKHGIAACKRDIYKGREFARNRRVSLTFREVLFPWA